MTQQNEIDHLYKFNEEMFHLKSLGKGFLQHCCTKQAVQSHFGWVHFHQIFRKHTGAGLLVKDQKSFADKL